LSLSVAASATASAGRRYGIVWYSSIHRFGGGFSFIEALGGPLTVVDGNPLTMAAALILFVALQAVLGPR
jgi:hypothetical protein